MTSFGDNFKIPADKKRTLDLIDAYIMDFLTKQAYILKTQI